jgi:hypothetical protein
LDTVLGDLLGAVLGTVPGTLPCTLSLTFMGILYFMYAFIAYFIIYHLSTFIVLLTVCKTFTSSSTGVRSASIMLFILSFRVLQLAQYPWLIPTATFSSWISTSGLHCPASIRGPDDVTYPLLHFNYFFGVGYSFFLNNLTFL